MTGSPKKFARMGLLCAVLLPMHPRTVSAQGMATGNVTAAPRAKPSGRPFPVSLVDVSTEAGLKMQFTSGDPKRMEYIIEANGTGVAFLDYNNDGLIDAFLVNGSKLQGFPNGGAPTNHLYRNDGQGQFTDTTQEAELGHSGWGNGVCAGDFDNDGNEDLFVTDWGGNVLYRNLGNGRFADVTDRGGVAGPADEWSTGCTFVDYDRDGYLDLFVVSYVNFNLRRTPKPGQFSFCTWKGAPVFCGPRGLPFGRATLFRNRGDGTFGDVSQQSGVSKARDFYGFTAVAADLNGDGWTDIYVASDSSPSLLFRNNKNGTFSEVGTESGIAYSENGAEQAGMGVAVSDYDNDGWLDLTKTNFTGDFPNLYHNQGKGFFEDAVFKAGLAVNPSFVLWGTGFVDLDNDGWKDILQVSGHVFPEVHQIDPRESYRTQRLVYRNLGNGRFEDVSAISGPAVAERHSSRGAAFGDFDNDGDVDVLVMNMHEAPSLLRNDLKSSNHWIKFRLQGTKSNRSAIGATVTIEAGGNRQMDAVVSQTSFLSENDRRLHFGLGKAARADKIIVRWPVGAVEEFPAAPTNSLYLLVEGTGITKRLTMKQ